VESTSTTRSGILGGSWKLTESDKALPLAGKFLPAKTAGIVLDQIQTGDDLIAPTTSLQTIILWEERNGSLGVDIEDRAATGMVTVVLPLRGVISAFSRTLDFKDKHNFGAILVSMI